MGHRTSVLGALIGSLLLPGCLPRPTPHTSYEAHSEVLAIPSYVLFQDSTGALSYQSPTASDLQAPSSRERVQGKACQSGLQLPVFTGGGFTVLSVGWGEGAYREALADARKKLAPEARLYDLRADVQVRTILLVWHEECLIVDVAVAPSATTAHSSRARGSL